MVQISAFSLNDYEEVYSLWQVTPGVGLSAADRREAIGTYLERNPGLSFVARSEGQLAGAVLCGSDGRRGYLHHLAVHPDFRRMGVGQSLVEHCLAGLHAAGYEKCHLFVFSGNAAGREFWEHIGWRLRTDLVMMSKDTEE